MAVTSHEREAAIKLSRSPAFLLVPLASVENFTCKRKSTAKVRHGQPKVESNKTKKKMASVQTAPRMNSIIIRTFRTPSMLATTWLHTGRSGFMPPSLFTFFVKTRECVVRGFFSRCRCQLFTATRQHGGENPLPATGHIFVTENLQINEVAVSGDAININSGCTTEKSLGFADCLITTGLMC